VACVHSIADRSAMPASSRTSVHTHRRNTDASQINGSITVQYRPTSTPCLVPDPGWVSAGQMDIRLVLGTGLLPGGGQAWLAARRRARTGDAWRGSDWVSGPETLVPRSGATVTASRALDGRPSWFQVAWAASSSSHRWRSPDCSTVGLAGWARQHA